MIYIFFALLVGAAVLGVWAESREEQTPTIEKAESLAFVAFVVGLIGGAVTTVIKLITAVLG